MDQLFVAFQKGDRGQFGLGLAIVQEVVTQHQGKIWASNEEDGVAFYIELETKRKNQT
jgi:two-component system sensor histidine kinase CssS